MEDCAAASRCSSAVKRHHVFHRAQVPITVPVVPITLALAAGVPLELVQRVTGHRTVAVVRTHYVRPGREDFHHALYTAMPQFLVKEQEVTGAKSPKEEIRRIVERVMPRTWKQDKARILQLLAKCWQ
jgi:hypothetical protein